jgi:hypothetical protein
MPERKEHKKRSSQLIIIDDDFTGGLPNDSLNELINTNLVIIISRI